MLPSVQAFTQALSARNVADAKPSIPTWKQSTSAMALRLAQQVEECKDLRSSVGVVDLLRSDREIRELKAVQAFVDSVKSDIRHLYAHMSTVVDTPARVAEMLGRRKTEAISLDGILSLPPLEFAAEAKSMDLEAQLAALQPVVFEERRFKAGDLVALVRLRESILTALHSDCNRVKTSLDAVLGTVPNLSTGSSTALTKPTEATLKAIHCHQGFLDLADLVNQARQRDDGLVEVLSVVQLKKTIAELTYNLEAVRAECANLQNRVQLLLSPSETDARRSLVSLDRVVVKTRQLESELVASVEAKAKLTSENNQLTELLARSEQDRKELGAHLKQLKATLLPRVTKLDEEVQKMSIEFKSVQVSVDTLSTMYSTHCEALQREKDASQALMQERDALTAAIARQLKTNGMLKQEISRQQRVSVQLSAAHTVLLSEYRQLKQAVSGARVL